VKGLPCLVFGLAVLFDKNLPALGAEKPCGRCLVKPGKAICRGVERSDELKGVLLELGLAHAKSGSESSGGKNTHRCGVIRMCIAPFA
jgi:hypothetical protein